METEVQEAEVREVCSLIQPQHFQARQASQSVSEAMEVWFQEAMKRRRVEIPSPSVLPQPEEASVEAVLQEVEARRRTEEMEEAVEVRQVRQATAHHHRKDSVQLAKEIMEVKVQVFNRQVREAEVLLEMAQQEGEV